MSDPRLTQLLNSILNDPRALLDDWLSAQLASPAARLDLIEEQTLALESREFLAALTSAVGDGRTVDLEDPVWQPISAFLEDLSKSRDEAGFSSLETATFILSLKQTLIRRILESRDHQAIEPGIWYVTSVLDRLALFTTDLFQVRRERTIRRQREEMEELATPVVKVWDGILALPLVGTLDTRRSRMVTEALLEAIASTDSEVAILDLTDVPAIDTRMAQHLMRTVAAARLMGARCILSGIRPQIAQTIVHLKIELGDIKTEATLAAALKAAFREADLKVVAAK